MPEPCPVYGHHAYRGETCTACRADFLETGRYPAASLHRDASTTPHVDHGQRAGHDRGDQD